MALLPVGLAILPPKSARNTEFGVKNSSICAERRQITAGFIEAYTIEITCFFTEKQCFSTF
jgi:hypothetical protein